MHLTILPFRHPCDLETRSMSSKLLWKHRPQWRLPFCCSLTDLAQNMESLRKRTGQFSQTTLSSRNPLLLKQQITVLKSSEHAQMTLDHGWLTVNSNSTTAKQKLFLIVLAYMSTHMYVHVYIYICMGVHQHTHVRACVTVCVTVCATMCEICIILWMRMHILHNNLQFEMQTKEPWHWQAFNAPAWQSFT